MCVQRVAIWKQCVKARKYVRVQILGLDCASLHLCAINIKSIIHRFSAYYRPFMFLTYIKIDCSYTGYIAILICPHAQHHIFSLHGTLLRLRMVVFLIYRFAGSGRESLTQLATSMAGSTLVRVNVTHNYGVKKFEEDLKPAVFAAGVHAKHVVFLLKDAQVRPQLSASKTFCRSRAIAHENGYSNCTCR